MEGFWTELTELTEWELAAKWASGRQQFRGALAKQSSASLTLVCSVDILFRFFTSFVSCSVFRLSFSSFCYPSVDSGRVASLPGLGLIVFVGNWVQGDWKVFLTELTEWEVAVKWDSGRQKFRGALAKQCIASLSLMCSMTCFVPVFHQFCFLFGV